MQMAIGKKNTYLNLDLDLYLNPMYTTYIHTYITSFPINDCLLDGLIT